MAKYRKKKGRSKMTLPVAVIAPVAAVGYFLGKELAAGQVGLVLKQTTGFENGKFSGFSDMVGTYGPILLGVGVHKVASMTGVNRALGQSKIPFIRI